MAGLGVQRRSYQRTITMPESLLGLSLPSLRTLLARTIHEEVEVREEERRTWGCEANQAPKRLLSNEQE